MLRNSLLGLSVQSADSTNLKKITGTRKAMKIGLFGLFGAGDLGKTYQCGQCGAKF